MHTLSLLESMRSGMRRSRNWAGRLRLKGRMSPSTITSGGVPRGEQIAGVDFTQLPNEVVQKFAEMMRERVEANMRRTDNLDPNDTSYRTVLVQDANTNGKIREFYRARPFTDDFKLPGRRVVRINAPEQRTLYSSNRREAASTWF
jgi:hypothetical protein